MVIGVIQLPTFYLIVREKDARVLLPVGFSNLPQISAARRWLQAVFLGSGPEICLPVY